MKEGLGVGRHRAYFTKGTALSFVIPESWAHCDLICSGGRGVLKLLILLEDNHSFLLFIHSTEIFELSLSTRLCNKV